MNNTSTEWEYDYVALLSPSIAVIFWFIFSIIFIGGIVGNILVILAVVGDDSMRHNNMNVLLTNMAFADLCNIVLCLADWSQILYFRAPLWILPSWICPVVRYCAEMFLYASLLTQMAVAVERYNAIIHPLRTHRIRSFLHLWLVTIWLCSAGFSIPYGLLDRVTEPLWPEGPRMCRAVKPIPLEFKSAECLVLYFIPLCLLSVLYSIISKVLWYDPEYLTESIRHTGRAAAVIRINGRRRVVKMLLCCIAVYFICYTPIQCLFVLSALTKFSIPSEYFSIIVGLNALCYASGACNPILYTVFSDRFRTRFKKLICCKKDDKRLYKSRLILNRKRKESEETESRKTSTLSYRQRVDTMSSLDVQNDEYARAVTVNVMADFHSRLLLSREAELV